MQHHAYYAVLQEIIKEGIKGKTFLEVGCGFCPGGQKLVEQGAEKIYGLDISEGMIESARKTLEEKRIHDKFELVCADMFDESF